MAYGDATAVKIGEVVVEYVIRSYGDGTYDWVTTHDEESDEWYETIEEAEADIRSRLGG